MILVDNGITCIEDWFKVAPPMGGSKQWKDGRSAKELARYFTSSLPYVPKEIESVLLNFISSDSVFKWEAEYVTDFSSFGLGRGEGRNHDAMMVNDEIFIGIEGKADESLGSDYIGTSLIDASDNKKHRINSMIDMLYGEGPENYVDIRYQLVTAASATLLEAKDRGLNKAILMVIVFKKEGCYSESKIKNNENDIGYFLSHSNAVKSNNCWKIPTYFGRDNGIELYFSEIIINLD